MTFLFPNFLEDPVTYKQAELRWQDEWQKLLRATGEEEKWQTPWINTTFADGTPCLDGNPIFSAVCPSRRLGIRVIQDEPSGNLRELSFWTDVFAGGEPEEIRELVVSCVLTTETLYDCLDLMSQWISREQVELSRSGEYSLSAARKQEVKGAFLSFSPPQSIPSPRRPQIAA